MTDTISQRLGAFAAQVAFADLPGPVQGRAKDVLLHAVVVGAGATATGFDGMASHAVSAGNGPGTDVFGGRGSAPAPLAAFANGIILHSRVQEDTHGTFHPGVCVLPAVLAVAQEESVSGDTVLAAVVAGYETGAALSRELTDRATPPHRATGVFGPVAAAAGVARLLGLSSERTTAAISLAAAMSGGSTESFGAGTQEWHFQSGQAAMTGVLAARLAQSGAVASEFAFEGVGGYLDCYAGGNLGSERVGSELGQRWGILEVTFKPYPVCAFNQAPVLAAVQLATEHDLDPATIASVEVSMSLREATYPGVDSRGPFSTPEQTLMSAPFCVAVGLTERNVTFDALRRFDAPAVSELLDRITVVADPARQQKSVVLRVRLTDGRVLEQQVVDTDTVLSWTRNEVQGNARRLLPETSIDERQLTELETVLDELELAEDLKGLWSALP